MPLDDRARNAPPAKLHRQRQAHGPTAHNRDLVLACYFKPHY